MSTFDGIVQEFPYIRIDYFRKSPERPPPLACFLSHVHSDHLQGLESFRAPFIYCSWATRELLLRIEKYPHRMNFNKGILESRRLHYKHLSKLLRPVPLNTPTEIELTPRLRIRVTLIDANHCAGSVMFLIEGDGKAILYTGDIRGERDSRYYPETWWTNSLIRHPVLIPYTLGRRRLDKIYLDTTFAISSNIYRKFPSKAEGLAELINKVDDYSDNTMFYFRAWTFGYEDVWITLSAALNTRIHLDRYQLGLYRSLASPRGGSNFNEAPPLCGFELGNRFAPGCLSDDENCRVHSCEPGVSCPMARSRKTIYIVPIVNRMNDGSEVPDTGTGGGTGDLYQTHELELPDKQALDELEKLCLQHIHNGEVLSRTTEALFAAFQSKNKSLSLDTYNIKDGSEMSLNKLVKILSHAHSDDTKEGKKLPKPTQSPLTKRKELGHDLPNTIHFPYSRHSSYSELCELVSAFKPQDIFPCTVDPTTWNEDVSIRRLFGHLCSGSVFAHDSHMREVLSNDENGKSHPREKTRSDVDFSSQSSQSQQTSTSMSDSDPKAIIENGIYHNQQDFVNTMTVNTAKQHHQKHDCHKGSMSTPTEPTTVTKPDNEPPSTSTRSMPRSSSSSSSPIPSKKRKRATESAKPTPTNKTVNEPLKAPELSTEAETKKRTEIRRARVFLKRKARVSQGKGQTDGESQSQKNGDLCIGPLPSSWEEDDSVDDIVDVKGVDKDIDIDMDMDMGIKARKANTERGRGRGQKQEQKQEQDTDEQENENSQSTTASTTSTFLSISDSAFDSQSQHQQLHSQLDDDDDGDGDDRLGLLESDRSTTTTTTNTNNNNINNSHPHQPKHRQHTPIRSRSLRARKEAYRAARADSYEAWSSMSLLSAGNNHSTEEMEL